MGHVLRIVVIVVLGGLAVAAQKLDDSNARWASSAVLMLVFIGAVADPLRGLIEEARSKSANRKAKLAALLDRWPVTASDLSLEEVGIPVSPIAASFAEPGEPPPYIDRDKEGELFQALAQRHFVLLIGPSGAGKSRMALHLLSQGQFENYRVVVPARPSDLPQLAGLRSELERGKTGGLVLWLEDVQHFFREGGLDARMVSRWCRGDANRILGTIRPGPMTELVALQHTLSEEAQSPLAKAVAGVIGTAARVHLDAVLSPGEAVRANEAYQGEDLTLGIGRVLLGGPELVLLLDYSGGEHPRGVAIVRAAADLWRTGAHRRATADDLEALHVHYLAAGSTPQETFGEGLSWASAPMESGATLLTPHADGYEVNDYILDHVDGVTPESAARTPIRLEAWERAVTLADPRDALDLAATAFSLEDESSLPATEVALTRAMTSSEPEVVATAALAMGLLLESRGQVDEAVSAYEHAEKQPRWLGPDTLILKRISAFYRGEEVGSPQDAARLQLRRLRTAPA
jgi:hypothetical protein